MKKKVIISFVVVVAIIIVGGDILALIKIQQKKHELTKIDAVCNTATVDNVLNEYLSDDIHTHEVVVEHPKFDPFVLKPDNAKLVRGTLSWVCKYGAGNTNNNIQTFLDLMWRLETYLNPDSFWYEPNDQYSIMGHVSRRELISPTDTITLLVIKNDTLTIVGSHHFRGDSSLLDSEYVRITDKDIREVVDIIFKNNHVLDLYQVK